MVHSMSFLDNLENSLKSLESSEEAAESRQREQQRRDSERARSISSAPWADKLKHSPFTAQLLKEATAAGFKVRTKVYITWIGTSLRLEARGRRLELQPTGEGISGVYSGDGVESHSVPVDLEGDPQPLIQWLLEA
jgi:hypothetical protein